MTSNGNRVQLQRVKAPLIFTWVGFVCAISFMEAWLKFTAPGVTLTTGLAIGQVVFGALNKVELCLALLIITMSAVDNLVEFVKDRFFLVALLVLFIQTLHMLPILSSRIDSYLSGNIPEPSNIHTAYVALEFVKVIALTISGLNQLRVTENV